MDRTEALTRLRDSQTGHLATVRPDGTPHIIVVTFALDGERLVTAIDHKPKTTTRLQRIINIEHQPRVSFLVDSYSFDWTRLWWVRSDGAAVILKSGVGHESAIEHLAVKYPQYQERPPEGAVIAIDIDHITGWTAT